MKKQYNILVADDDAAIGLIVPTILRRLGHTAEIAEDGREAIKLFTLRPGHYDMVITDHNMPGMNGLDLVQYLRKNGFEGKIVVMSGALTEDLVTAYKARRVDKILQKPFTIEALSAGLGDLLEAWASAE